jgi:hypothetical protein
MLIIHPNTWSKSCQDEEKIFWGEVIQIPEFEAEKWLYSAEEGIIRIYSMVIKLPFGGAKRIRTDYGLHFPSHCAANPSDYLLSNATYLTGACRRVVKISIHHYFLLAMSFITSSTGITG